MISRMECKIAFFFLSMDIIRKIVCDGNKIYLNRVAFLQPFTAAESSLHLRYDESRAVKIYDFFRAKRREPALEPRVERRR